MGAGDNLLYIGVTYLLYSGVILLYTGVTYLLYSGVISLYTGVTYLLYSGVILLYTGVTIFRWHILCTGLLICNDKLFSCALKYCNLMTFSQMWLPPPRMIIACHPEVRHGNRPFLTLWLWRLNPLTRRGDIVFLFPKTFPSNWRWCKSFTCSLNITFNWNFVNLCKPRQCLGLIVYCLCSV